jgi:hypothetical protein
MTWESNQEWHLGRAREPYRLPEQLPQLRIDPGGSSRRSRKSSSLSSAAAQSIRTVVGMVNELMTVLTDSAAQAGRGHAFTIDSGWSEVADTVPAFIQRFTQGQKGGSHAY